MEIVSRSGSRCGQLNEFINYSRPREVRCADQINAAGKWGHVRALTYDLEEKADSIAGHGRNADGAGG